jgi:hypothetical protein
MHDRSKRPRTCSLLHLEKAELILIPLASSRFSTPQTAAVPGARDLFFLARALEFPSVLGT